MSGSFDSQGLSQHKCNLNSDARKRKHSTLPNECRQKLLCPKNFEDGPAFRVFDTSKSVSKYSRLLGV